MLPVEVTLEGILSYNKKVTLNFQNITSATVSGSNGVGKSSLVIDPIPFILWGESREDLADQINEENTSGYGTFKFLKNEKLYEVTRTIKRLKDNKSASSLSILENGVPHKDRLKRTKQESLNDILGFSKELLLHTHVSCQDDAKALCTIGINKREQILTDLLGFNIWKKKKDKTAEFINLHKNIDELLEQKQVSVKDLQNEYTLYTDKLRDVRDHLDVLKNELIAQEVILDIQHNIFVQVQKQDILNEQRIKYDVLIDTLLNNIASMSTELFSTEHITESLHHNTSLLRTLSTQTTNYNKKLNQLKIDLNRAFGTLDIANTYSKKEDELAVLDTVPCKDTPFFNECHLLASAHHFYDELHAYLSYWEMGTLDELVGFLVNLIDGYKSEINVLEHSIAWTVTQYADAEELTQNLKRQLVSHTQIKQWDKELRDTEERRQKVIDQLVPLATTYDIIQIEQKKLYDIKELLNKEESLLNQLLNSQNSILMKLQNENEELHQLKINSQKVSRYKELYQAYNDIPSHLFVETIPHIEDYANDLLEQILPGRYIEFRTHRDTQDKVQVKSFDILWVTSTGVRKFRMLSGAEQFIASLVLRLAISRVNSELYNIPFDFFIIDEGFGNLDAANIESVKQVLRSIAPNFKLFLIITHVDSLKDTFETQVIINPEDAEERVVIIR